LLGDPIKNELIVYRVKFPPYYKIAPHTHPYTELVTVISGTQYNAMGTDYGTEFKPGSSFMLPANCAIRTWFGGEETIIQITCIGPTAIDFVNPKDDPRQQQPVAETE
jgi:quercetin dioxygenase-like cupin family protein